MTDLYLVINNDRAQALRSKARRVMAQAVDRLLAHDLDGWTRLRAEAEDIEDEARAEQQKIDDEHRARARALAGLLERTGRESA